MLICLSASQAADSIAADRTRLEYILGQGHVSAEEARAALLDLISRSDEAVGLCGARFPAKTFPGQPAIMSHCVRCHEEFDANYNTGKQCTVDHVEDGEMEHNMWGYFSSCGCELDGKGSNHASDYKFVTDFCYEGPHTANKAEVEDTASTRSLRQNCSDCRQANPAKK